MLFNIVRSSIAASLGFGKSALDQQVAHFSKYISKSRAKRLPLNTKRAGKGYKKGYGARKEGYLTSKAKFVAVPSMRTELVVPDLTNFKLRPYVAPGTKRNITDINPAS
mmetsp:Transcript_21651/g.31512  ORF Transcript_21651/g.31512 Transcript_21651/m.31512 type:complete len:109 (-) Transcript_21651:117-443(-)